MSSLKNKNIFIKKVVIISLFAFSLAVFLLPNIILAASGPDQLLYGGTGLKDRTQSVLGLGSEDPRIIIASVIRVILGFLGILGVGLIMYGGWLYMTSEGDEKQIETAKNVLKNAVIGLIIILSSFALVSFILTWLYNSTTGSGNRNPGEIPDGGHGIGVIGSCSVASVFPEPFADDVPRNTAIIVTFKEEIYPSSICAETEDDTTTPDVIANEKCKDGSSIKTVDGLLVTRIYQSAQVDKCDAKNQDSCLKAKIYTRDNKTFVFVPDDILGSPAEKIWHTVYLTNDIQTNQIVNNKHEGVFSHCRTSDYLEWSFNVSTKLDLVPPKVYKLEESGIFPPLDNSQGDVGVKDIAKNAVIKINFDEAINPYTISGDAEVITSFIKVICTNLDNSKCELNDNTFDCGTQSNPQTCVKGNFEISNGYSTVEFISNNKCGTNNCGEDIFCLPGGKKISVLLNSASLFVTCADDLDCATRNPYSLCGTNNNICQAIACVEDNDCAMRNPNSKCVAKKCLVGADEDPINYPMGNLDGVLDVAMNSLDGNRNYNAQGQAGTYNENTPSVSGDNYTWSFWTSNEFDLTPPIINTVEQDQEKGPINMVPVTVGSIINLINPFGITFNKIMMSSSLRSSPVTILGNIHQGVNLLAKDYDTDQYIIDATSSVGYWIGSKDDMITKMFINHDMLLETTDYRGQVGSRVKDIFQNCYMPCAGPGCATADNYASCCNGATTTESTCQ